MSETQATHDDAQTTTVAIYFAAGHSRDEDVDTESERFLIARDLRGFGSDAFDELERDPQTAFDVALDQIGDAVEITDDFENTTDLLQSVFMACQGPAKPDTLPYDGTQTRSMQVGDVIVADGTAHMVDSFGFAKLDVSLD